MPFVTGTPAPKPQPQGTPAPAFGAQPPPLPTGVKQALQPQAQAPAPTAQQSPAPPPQAQPAPAQQPQPAYRQPQANYQRGRAPAPAQQPQTPGQPQPWYQRATQQPAPAPGGGQLPSWLQRSPPPVTDPRDPRYGKPQPPQPQGDSSPQQSTLTGSRSMEAAGRRESMAAYSQPQPQPGFGAQHPPVPQAVQSALQPQRQGSYLNAGETSDAPSYTDGAARRAEASALPANGRDEYGRYDERAQREIESQRAFRQQSGGSMDEYRSTYDTPEPQDASLGDGSSLIPMDRFQDEWDRSVEDDFRNQAARRVRGR